MFVIGIDAGGTKTVCQLADEHGTVLAEARGAGANLQANGELEVEKALHAVMAEAIGRDRAIRPSAICCGMAGVDRPEDVAAIRAILTRIGQKADLLVVNDALIALEAGAPGQAGVVIVAGTGSIAYGRDTEGRAARSGGWGHMLGDEGSGYWLGRQALQAVVRASDGRGPATSLTARVLQHYGVGRAQDLVHQIYYGGARPSAIATLGVLVQAAADDADAIALQIIDTGAGELAAAATSVASRLGLGACPVILSGGMFRAVPRLAAGVVARLATTLPKASARPLTVEPARGAVHLALALAAGHAVVPAYMDGQ
ncbi:MAG TPA: BadF/BadG/BcrA/BcrD ATPase family protein [Vicinamibacterales bacterium]|nr:BadF/BadG/BcrA/BcrD ATPase family protein [Vicinamibacterales bacterium]